MGFLKDILGSHIFGDEKSDRALSNIRYHLNDNGVFAINIQPLPSNSDKLMKDGVLFKQRVEEHYSFCYEDYIFEKDGEVLFQQRCTYQLWKDNKVKEVLERNGFQNSYKTLDGKFRVLKCI